MFKKQLWLISLLSVLTACSTTTTEETSQGDVSYDYDSLYLRGSFSWWEADENYRVTEMSKGVYSVVVELVADGQPYDFKFADKEWTNGLSCGYRDKDSDEVIELGRSVDVNCFTPVDNFIFVPKESGKYIFKLDFNGWGDPELTVNKL